MQSFSHLIDGELVSGGRDFEVVNPATGAPFARCPDATREEVDAAMGAAARAFAGEWSRDEAGRRRTLAAMSEALAAAADELGRLVCLEQGKPLAQATGEVRGAARLLKRYADEPIPREVLREDQKVRVTVVRRPLGVAAAITPWNYPVATLVAKIGPAFVAGNDPAIVLPDVDPAQVAPRLFWGAFTNSGQICIAIKRLYVHERAYRPLVDALAALARQVKLGDGLEPDTQLGPINNRPQFERVRELVDDARRAGGHVVVGGAPLPRPGYFYPPTVVTDVGEGVRLVDEEQFGTALPVIPWRDLDDALAQANHTHYGLGGSVWSADVARGEEIAARLECGTAWVNQHMSMSARVPFGGVKWSGIGRENGRWGIEEFCELQVVNAAKA